MTDDSVRRSVITREPVTLPFNGYKLSGVARACVKVNHNKFNEYNSFKAQCGAGNQRDLDGLRERDRLRYGKAPIRRGQ